MNEIDHVPEDGKQLFQNEHAAFERLNEIMHMFKIRHLYSRHECILLKFQCEFFFHT